MIDNYWNKKGKYQDKLEKIRELIPSIGKTNNKYLNLYLTTINIYYDVYNNGGCNIKDCYIDDINKYISPFKNEISSINFNVSYKTIINNLKNLNKLEKFLNEIILIVCNKNLTYEKYVVYMDFNLNQLSINPQEGFQEISFGNKEEYDKWVDHRVNVFKFNFI